MDEDQYSYSEESITMSSQSWFWKKKNSVSSAAKSQSKTEAWVRTIIPSGSEVPEDSVRIDPESKLQTTIHSSVPLPGSIIDCSGEIQEHPSCVIKSVTIEDTPEEDGEGNSWLHKLGMNVNKWSFLNSLIGWSENRALEKVDLSNTSAVCSDADHEATELEECTPKEVPYIPYKLAALYITKIAKDMQQMKNKHMKIIRQLDHVRKENQEQTIAAIKKHYGEKMRNLKLRLEAYREVINKDNTHWQDTFKSLRERNRQLIQEKEDLIHQMKQQTEKWEEEKVWIVENLCRNVDCLYTQHMLTLQELHNISIYVERVHDLMNIQIKILHRKSEKTEGEITHVSEVLELKTDQVANEEAKPEWSMEKGYLCQARTVLQKIQECLQKQEREVTELLQSQGRHNKAMKPQITVLIFLKTLVKTVHTIYCDVPGAQQYISQLVRKNEDERADRKEAFNNSQADIVSYEIFYGNEPTDDERTQLSAKLFRNLGKSKSDLEYVETEKIVFDCIQTGEIPNWIKRDCLYVALTGTLQRTLQHALRRQSHHPGELMQKLKTEIKPTNGIFMSAFLIVLPLESMAHGLFHELGNCLGGTCIGYAVVIPTNFCSPDGQPTLLPPEHVQELNLRSTGMLNAIQRFFAYHMIETYGCDYSTSGLTFDTLHSKIKSFLELRTADGPRHDTYILYYSGHSHGTGEWALAGGDALRLDTLLEWWREKNGTFCSRLIIVLDCENSQPWVKEVRKVNDQYVAVQGAEMARVVDVEEADPPQLGDFTRQWVEYNCNPESNISWSDKGRTVKALYGVSKRWSDYTLHLPTGSDVAKHWMMYFPHVTYPLVHLANWFCGLNLFWVCKACFRCLKRLKMSWFLPTVLDTGQGFKLVKS